METYVLKYKDKYCRFESHSTVSLVENPTIASLYSNCKTAQQRLKRRCWLKREEIPGEQLVLVRLELSIVKETIVNNPL